MNIYDYITGDRYGKEAHRLEQESIYDPFLQDAIDGYDQIDDQALFHLENLEKQIRERTKNRNYFLQIAGIFACVFALAALSFYLYDYKNTDNTVNTGNTSISNPVNTSQIKNDIIKDHPLLGNPEVKKDSIVNGEKKILTSKAATTNENTAKNQIAGKGSSIYQVLRNMDFDENQSFYRQYGSENVNENSLSDSEVQEIINRGYNQRDLTAATEATAYPLSPEIAKTVNVSNLSEITKPIKKITVYTETTEVDNSAILKPPPPAPVVGDKAYKDYIDKNRKKFTDKTCEKPHGKVILVFRVNEKGRPNNITVLRSLCQAVDREAIRLLQNGPDWTYSDINGRLEILF